jgi:hypothetical protein
MDNINNNLNTIFTLEHAKSIIKFLQRVDLKPHEIDEFVNLLHAVKSLAEILSKK